jgi:hypothetical protein
MRREKELEDKNEERRLLLIKQTVSTILQSRIQQILKDKSISHEQKSEILKLKKTLE